MGCHQLHHVRLAARVHNRISHHSRRVAYASGPSTASGHGESIPSTITSVPERSLEGTVDAMEDDEISAMAHLEGEMRQDPAWAARLHATASRLQYATPRDHVVDRWGGRVALFATLWVTLVALEGLPHPHTTLSAVPGLSALIELATGALQHPLQALVAGMFFYSAFRLTQARVLRQDRTKSDDPSQSSD